MPAGATDEQEHEQDGSGGGKGGEEAQLLARCISAACEALLAAEAELNALDAKVNVCTGLAAHQCQYFQRRSGCLGWLVRGHFWSVVVKAEAGGRQACVDSGAPTGPPHRNWLAMRSQM